MNRPLMCAPGAGPVSRKALLFFCVFLAGGSLGAQSTPLTGNNWGMATAPVYGSSESGAYSGAELFAGPKKFGAYFSGVLPNGRMVKPAGETIQTGMNPLGIALTPDGKYLVTSNDDERNRNVPSYQSETNVGGYSLSVVETATMRVASQHNVSGRFFVGLQITGAGPYTVWASGGGDNDVKLFTITEAGAISPADPAKIDIAPVLPSAKGYVSHYEPGPGFKTPGPGESLPPVPTQFNRESGARITFPAGSTLSPDGRFLYVACNGDNSVAVIDTAKKTVAQRVPAGYFPYSVSVDAGGETVAVSNWGIMEYKFHEPVYEDGKLARLPATAQNQPDGFYVPEVSDSGPDPKTSSLSLFRAARGNGSMLTPAGARYEGHKLDELFNVGDTHPSATAVVRRGGVEALYVTKSNSDSLGVVLLPGFTQEPDVDLSPLSITLNDGHKVHGAYPNALAVSNADHRLYVAEAGINSVAVLDTAQPPHPRLLGRIPTGWYPSALAVSPDGRFLYIANAKGVGEDINPKIDTSQGDAPPSGLGSDPDPRVDSNYVFGSLQKVDLRRLDFKGPDFNSRRVLDNNFALREAPHEKGDAAVVPVGGAPSKKIKHVFFILHENKTFDSMLGNMAAHFGPFAGMVYNQRDGSTYKSRQYTGVALNAQALAERFAAAVNYYSDSEESDAGHQFAASGTASDYTEKTLLVKNGRGLLVNKNFEPEDYPEGGYIFNNAARHGVSFKDYGALVRIQGTDTGTSVPATLNDPESGKVGYPKLQEDKSSVSRPPANAGDVSSPASGLGQSYFMSMPVLAVLGGKNRNGESRLDRHYPGYNFNISDQRRAREFIADFDRMAKAGTLPQFFYIYQPNDHTGDVRTGDVQAPNAAEVGHSPFQQVADGDVGLGMVVRHIMESPIYYDAKTGEGSAIFVTWDDAQSSFDHLHPHRTPLLVISPYARPGYVAKRHYSTASVVKTEELLLGLPPNNLGDLLATDLRDMFQDSYNGVTVANVEFSLAESYTPSEEGRRIWALVDHLDTSAPDRDSRRLGGLIRFSQEADELHNQAARENRLEAIDYKERQEALYQAAVALALTPGPEE